MQNESFHNLIYALVQAGHNAGAALLFGGYFIVLFSKKNEITRSIYLLVLSGWLIQAVSGSLFGAASFTFYGKLPDLGQIGKIMLTAKILCVICGFSLVAVLFLWENKIHENRKKMIWNTSFILAFTALSCAAFLRWFS